jgi:undecaprenyl-diphosphatase
MIIDTIKSIDESLSLFLNAQHNSVFDSLMWYFSAKLFWVPLYVWFLWLLYRKYPKHFWTVIVAIILMMVASDQLCNLSKNTFMRLRPSQEPHLQSLLHLVNGYRGGSFSFYSGHASNTFAVALFMIVTLAGKRNYIVPVALLYASLTAYSRIYLGVHYFGDVLTGAIAGAMLGTGFAYAHATLRDKYLNPVKSN